MPASTLGLRVATVEQQNAVVRVLELRNAVDQPLPAFEPGAHIDLHLGNGLVRSYSIVNDCDERHRYVLAVGLDPATRGGSRWIHDRLQPGAMLHADGPRNNFRLHEGAPHSVFMAGGIGITPLLCMARRLTRLRRSWELHYVARTPGHAAFLAELEAMAPQVQIYFDAMPDGRALPLARLVADARADTHLYCCGPAGMLAAYEEAAARRDPATVHLERFSGVAPAASGGFEIALARSGRTLTVAPGQSILDTLVAAGLKLAFSCQQGVCGTCETRVLEGTPEHHDQVLSKRERDSGKVMMICCSGSKSPRLVLDL